MPVTSNQFANLEVHSESEYYRPSRPPKSKSQDGKPCRACTDFKSWITNPSGDRQRTDCPLSRSELGRNTWSFLHTMAAHFPDRPSAEDSRDMANFFRVFSRFYPCPTCAKDFTKLIEKEPPKTGSQDELKHWLCWAHNQVNKKLGKPKFDCTQLDERWKYGWKDGSCD